MNAWVQQLGIDALKPLLTALLLPPVPWLVLIVLGGWLLARRRSGAGWGLLLAGVALEWASGSAAAADALARWLLTPPPAITQTDDLARRGAGKAIVIVLGGGRTEAAEYPGGTLSPISIERLRYGAWLSRKTGLPLAFSGGLSPGSTPGASEGELALRIAAEELQRPLAWVEARSRDTRENAAFSVELLHKRPVEQVVLVTHDLHMRRALRHFEHARDTAGLAFVITPAPVGQTVRHDDWALSDFYPTASGLARMRYTLREWLGILAGA